MLQPPSAQTGPVVPTKASLWRSSVVWLLEHPGKVMKTWIKSCTGLVLFLNNMKTNWTSCYKFQQFNFQSTHQKRGNKNTNKIQVWSSSYNANEAKETGCTLYLKASFLYQSKVLVLRCSDAVVKHVRGWVSNVCVKCIEGVYKSTKPLNRWWFLLRETEDPAEPLDLQETLASASQEQRYQIKHPSHQVLWVIPSSFLWLSPFLLSPVLLLVY